MNTQWKLQERVLGDWVQTMTRRWRNLAFVINRGETRLKNKKREEWPNLVEADAVLEGSRR